METEILITSGNLYLTTGASIRFTEATMLIMHIKPRYNLSIINSSSTSAPFEKLNEVSEK